MILVCSQVWVQKPEDNFRACFSLSTIGSGDQTQVIWLEWQVPLLPESSCRSSRSSYALRCWIPPISCKPSARAPNWPRLLCLQLRLFTLLTPVSALASSQHQASPALYTACVHLGLRNAAVCNLCTGYEEQMTRRASLTNAH